ncbi:MAG TPA: hypothetical protein VFT12_02980 [Thermoanaerobaculia bacterium]|nr:hypothetical protein [Thermoanaerobaculia bacterium]
MALSLPAAPPELKPVKTRDQKIVRRWGLEGSPRGVAIGANGVIYAGLADRQSVIAVNPSTGAVIKEAILDSAHIAATKELVSLRMNPARTRLYIANGSDESATILSLPNMAVVREITMEGEIIRDALPDPSGRLLFLLGRRVHVFDADGRSNLRTLPFEDPMAIAVTSSGSTLAVFGSEDFGNAKATVVVLYDTTTFSEIAREPLQTEQTIEAALFAASDRALVALGREHLFEKPVVSRKNSVAQVEGTKAQLRMAINFGDLVNSERVCLPEDSGPQIATLGSTSDQVLFAERRCSSSGAFAGAERRITPASLYGVNAYAVAYDKERNVLVATDREGYLTIYKAPRPALAR